MIKRLKRSTTGYITPTWPPDEDDRAFVRLGALYAGRKRYRKFRLMIDAEILDPSRESSAQSEFLADLLNHGLLIVYRYLDDGPPDSARDTDGRTPGWAVVTKAKAPPNRQWEVELVDPKSTTYTAVIGNGVHLAEHDVQSGVYEDSDPRKAAERRAQDSLAGQVAAQAVHADVYITERPYLHAERRWSHHDVAICTPEEGLAVLGLYFRAQDEFLIAHNKRLGRQLFYWVGTRELLPEAWRWFSACVNHSMATEDDSLMSLAGSLLDRTSRALEARDAIHVALNGDAARDTAERVLRDLDSVLLFLMGAVDVSARVAHRVLGLSGHEYNAAWQRSWIKSVRKAAPDLADVVSETPGKAALTILGLLRNSIHGEAIRAVALREAAQPWRTLVTLPSTGLDEVLPAMDQLGTRPEWGIHDTQGRPRILLDAGIFVDRLFAHVIPLLNALMARTPVEDLEHADLTPAAGRPPEGDTMFSEYTRKRVRLQLGIQQA